MTEDKRVPPPGPAASWIARSLRQYRELRGLSYNELARRLGEVGRPIAPLGLRRTERGDRRVDVDDLLALAKALEVPPVLLIFPLGEAVTTEVLPGLDRPTWQVVKWFHGDAPFPGSEQHAGEHDYLAADHPDTQAFFDAASPAIQHRTHDRYLDDLRWMRNRLPVIAKSADEAQSEEARTAHLARLEDAERETAERERVLVEHRRKMRQAGVVPPPLEPALAHLDNGSTSEEGGEA